ncbi:hypothetical protein FQN60_010765 [Etheostoma spectabile]|uniref:Fibronectin type-III domain-containing protein n=1 Tax=Etheostoma spectabile TaxID=54343 RepID=A0A5J5DPV1_9PERO|nr:hypothetical protein FQN60_010765 [Etheostoma spectabile]
MCQRCAPLYNDKPFRSGDQLQPMNCRSCQCHGHALSCHYDVGADEQPDEHYRGGGGVCDNCIHNTTGTNCELCIRGFFRLEESDPTSVDLCQPCNCNTDGTVNSSMECAQVFLVTAVSLGIGTSPTMTAVSREHVEGRRCDSCRRGYHTLEQRNSLGCLPCACDIQGTVPEGVCDMWTGQCLCREGAEGAQCTSCAHNYYNRSLLVQKGLSQGCVPCICDLRGTVTGSVCDSTTGQCVCVPTRYGKDCSSCRTGYYLSPDQSMCAECDCHPMGASQRGCESQTGQCVCAHPSVGGRRCDQCREMFFGFNPGLGRCQPCACDPVGSVNSSCHPDSGVCVCKPLVTGERFVLSSMEFSGAEPVIHYTGLSTEAVASGLKPFTQYTVILEVVPELMAPPEVFALSSTSLKVTWSTTEGQGIIARGQVTEYRVNMLSEQTSNPYAPPVVSQVLHRVGPSSQPVYLVEGLKPYHVYNFTVTLCTTTGCISSLPNTGRTLPAGGEDRRLSF